MDYIKGRLNIINDLNKHTPASYVYYSANGTSYGLVDLIENLEGELPKFSYLRTPDNILSEGIDLTFNTIKGDFRFTGAYEAIMYPAELGRLSHIFCVGSYEDSLLGTFHIDLLNTWICELITYKGSQYYLYVQDRKVKDNNVRYNFLFETGEN